jgi:hypothetical protein
MAAGMARNVLGSSRLRVSARGHGGTMAFARSTFRLPAALALAFVLAALGCSTERDEIDGKTIKNVRQLVYAVRQHTTLTADGVQIDVSGGGGQVMDYLRYVPGGRIEIYDLARNATENILEQFPSADVSGLDLSFDATKLVFSMKQDENDNYHLYWAGLARGADGRFEIHQLTFGPYDDIHPVYVAGDKIAFATNQGYTEMGTRADEYNHAQQVTQLATVTLASGDADRKLCSQNLSHTVNLFAMQDGRVGFSRWEHLENVNDMKLFAMNPDCTQMVALAGQHQIPAKPGNALIQVAETNTQNVFLAITTSRNKTLQSGALIRIDARNPNDPKRFYEETPAYEILTPAVPRDGNPSPVGRYRTPHPLPDGRILVSWASGFVNELNELSLTPPDYGVYIYDPASRTNQLIVNHEDSWELYARPVIARPQPPIISSIQDSSDPSVPTVFGSVDIKQTSLHALHGETVSGAQFDKTPMDQALAQTKKVRIIEGFSSEAATGVTMFGLTMAEGAAIVGEAEVYADGSWLAEIPPYIPVHLQPLDEFELAIRSQTTWIQGMPGEARVCGGCHENRSLPVLPSDQQLTIAAGKGPEKFNRAVAERAEFPWFYADDPANPNEVQKLLTTKCASCHNQSTNGDGPQEFYELTMQNELTGSASVYQIPRMDLSDRPIAVTYDTKMYEWPASYVSLFYPSALAMQENLGGSVVGTIPPIWAVPSDARGSLLIEKLNMTSSLDAGKTAWPLGQPFSDPNVKGGTRSLHPENVGVTLERAERTLLIRVIDLGGQYYARQNTQFVPFGNNPLVPGEKY